MAAEAEQEGSVPPTMAAVVLTGYGGFDKQEYRTDWPTPRPGAGEVLVRVRACGCNNTDINTRTGWYSQAVRASTEETAAATPSEAAEETGSTWDGEGVSFPRIQGADVVGSVVAVGEGVPQPGEWLAADRVVVDPWLRNWDDLDDIASVGFVGLERNGGFAQFVAVPYQNVHRTTSARPFPELATLACSWITAENMLTRARVTAGETVLVTGASGGVGSALVQLATARGATVVAVASEAKLDRLRSLGAASAVPRSAPNLRAAVRDAAGIDQVDVVADVVAGPAFPQLLEVLRRCGRYVVSGAVAGPIVELDVRTLYLKDLELIGATVPPPTAFRSVLRQVEEGLVRPVFAKAYPLANIQAAQEAFLAKEHVGSLVLVPPAE